MQERIRSYVDGIRRTDRLCLDVWKAIQDEPEYSGKQRLFILPDLAVTRMKIQPGTVFKSSDGRRGLAYDMDDGFGAGNPRRRRA